MQQPGYPHFPPGASDYVKIGRLSARLRKQAYGFAKNSASHLERFVRLSALFRGASRRPSKQSLFLSCQDSFAWATLRLTHSCQRLRRPPVPSRLFFHGQSAGPARARQRSALIGLSRGAPTASELPAIAALSVAVSKFPRTARRVSRSSRRQVLRRRQS